MLRTVFRLSIGRRTLNVALRTTFVPLRSQMLVPQVTKHCQITRSFSDDSHSDFAAQHKVLSSDEAIELIKEDVSTNDVFLYMKGTPDAPQCGFSRQVAMILQHLQVPFASRNVLENAQIRDSIKVHSDWPTIPQLYVKGEFLGGCDIVTEMFKKGELTELLIAGKIPVTDPQKDEKKAE